MKFHRFKQFRGRAKKKKIIGNPKEEFLIGLLGIFIAPSGLANSTGFSWFIYLCMLLVSIQLALSSLWKLLRDQYFKDK
jgi:hypothetical protein